MQNGKTPFLLLTSLITLAISVGGGQFAKADEKHPTKDEVVAFVNEGLEYAKKNGREAFFKELMNDNGIFKRGELYFYAYDFEGLNLAHGAKPHLVGKNLIELTDKKGLPLIQALRDAAAAGGGWVEYYWENPETKVVQKKLGYVIKLDDGCWFGSGTYVDE
jgi:hypothetical protein